jgi:nicotinamidase-related amidase
MPSASLEKAPLAELIHPKHTALVVIDPQNDLCLINGAIGKMNYDRSIYDFSVYPPMLEKLKWVLDAARRSHVTVIYTQAIAIPERLASPHRVRMALKIYRQTDPMCLPKSVVEGTWGHEFIEEVKPRPTDIVIKKHTNSAFFGTSLDMLLRNNNIRTLVITGCQTDGCVESTVRDASYSLGYVCVIVKDCVASFSRECHEAMMKVFERRFDVVSLSEIVDAWEGASVASGLIKS